NEGRVVADGPVDQVTARTGAPRFLVLVDPPSVDKAVQALQSERITVSTNRQMDGQIEVELGTEDPEQASAIRREILQSLVDARIDVLGFTNRASRLEEVFLSLTQGVAS
ncbi:MAG: hypothetical protein OEY55_11250, partial [Acidimicrobiia bacterium]|nr:hypothetical protein [Acidimicrobiia bacterium]